MGLVDYVLGLSNDFQFGCEAVLETTLGFDSCEFMLGRVVNLTAFLICY